MNFKGEFNDLNNIFIKIKQINIYQIFIFQSLIASSSSSICEIGGNCSPGAHAGEELDRQQTLNPQPFCAIEKDAEGQQKHQ